MTNIGRYGALSPAPSPATGTVYASNPPTGLTVISSSATTAGLSWNSVANATGYTVNVYDQDAGGGPLVTQVPGNQLGATIGQLKANTAYKFTVEGTPAKAGGPVAVVSARTSR
jgi:hypothetical protein